MLDFNIKLQKDAETVKYSVRQLNDYGDRDASLNYLYFMREEINKLIKAENRKRKATV